MIASSLLRRWFVFSTLLTSLPILFLGVFSYTIASNGIQEKVDEGNLQNLLQTQMRVEQLLKTLEYVVMQYVSSPIVNNALYKSLTTTTHFKEINDLSQGLHNLHFFVGVQDASLINVRENWYIGKNGFGSNLKELADYESLERYTSMRNNLVWMPDSTSSPEMGTLNLICKVPLLNFSVETSALLILKIKKSELNRQFLAQNELGNLFVLDRSRQAVLGDPNIGELSVEVRNRITEMIESLQSRNGHFPMDWEGRDVWIHYIQSPQHGWTYLAVQDAKKSTMEVRQIGIFTLASCAALFLLFGAAALYGSHWMYSPIRGFVQFLRSDLGNKDEGDVIDDFADLAQRIRHLMNSGLQMQDQLTFYAIQLRDSFVQRLLAGKITKSRLLEHLSATGFPVAWKRLIVFVVQIDTLKNTRYQERDHDLLLFAIGNIVGDLVDPMKRFQPVSMDNSQVTILASEFETDEECSRWALSIAEDIRIKIAEFLGLKVSIGVSRSYVDLVDVSGAYQEGLEALKYRFQLGSEMILHINDIQLNRNKETVYPKQLERDIVDAVKLGHPERISTSLEVYLLHAIQSNIHIQEFQFMLMQLIVSLTELLYGSGLSAEKVVGDKQVAHHLLQGKSLIEWKRWLLDEIAMPIANHLRDERESHNNRITEDLIRIIEKEFESNLSLEDCSARLNFHPVYVSRVFKKETGLTFSDFLAQHRLRIAKKWLVETDMTILEIATRLNYANSTPFIRYFSKATGVTPGKYRKDHMQL